MGARLPFPSSLTVIPGKVSTPTMWPFHAAHGPMIPPVNLKPQAVSETAPRTTRNFHRPALPSHGCFSRLEDLLGSASTLDRQLILTFFPVIDRS